MTTPTTSSNARFYLGRVLITPRALEALAESNQHPLEFLQRHVSGDWGEVCDEDKSENELSIREGFRRHCQLKLMQRWSRHKNNSNPSLAATSSLNFCPLQAAVWTQLTSAHVVNLNCISARYRSALSRCRRTRKCDEMIPKAERKRCACPADLNRRITFSRTLVG